MLRRTARFKRQAQGFALLWMVIGLTAIMGMAAVGIDVSMWYARKADLQKTADDAALAGGYCLEHGQSISLAIAKANQIATLNGYSLTVPSDPTNPNGDPNSDISYPYSGHPNWFTVRVKTNEIPYFARVVGHGLQHLEATATSQYVSPIESPIIDQEAGYSGLASNWSLFGPYAWRAYGDRYSPLYNSNTVPAAVYNTDGSLQANSEHLPDGYDFTVAIPSNYAAMNHGSSQLQVELFDPDTYNAKTSGGVNAVAETKDANGNITGGAVDEIRNGQLGRTQSNGDTKVASSTAGTTTTQFQLMYTPTDTTVKPTVIATATYSNDVATDLSWVTPSGFTFDASQYMNGRVHIQVTTTNGSSENGFSIRSGPVHATNTVTNAQGTYQLSAVNETVWHNLYSGDASNTAPTAVHGINGTKMSARGQVPINFNADGAVDLVLGFVPSNAKGGSFYVERFDTDLTPGSKRVLSYTCDTISSGYTVTLDPNEDPNHMDTSDNNVTRTDTIKLPTDYPGGTWTAHYSATAQDSSTWKLYATTPGDGTLSLVGNAGALH